MYSKHRSARRFRRDSRPSFVEPLEPRRLLTHPLGPGALIVSENSRVDGAIDVASDADGDFVVVWRARLENDDRVIRGRLYDRAGLPRGDEFTVHGSGDGANVAMDANGDFVVAWNGGNVRRYNANGTPAGAAVNVSTDAGTNTTDVAMEDNGDFVVAWSSFTLEDATAVRARRFDAAGNSLGSTITVATDNGTAADFLIDPAIATDANGDFVIAYKRGQQTFRKPVVARRYDNAGAAIGGEFPVSADGEDANLSDPAVSMDDAGAFVVTWANEEHGGSSDRDGDSILARRYNAAGIAQGGSFVVNTDAGGDQASPDVAVDADGDFVITWDDPSDELITARRYSAAGVAEGNEFDVDLINPFAPFQPAIAAEENGNFVVAWEMSIGGGQFKAFVRRFSPDETDPPAPSVPNLNATSDTGSSNSDNVTRDTTPIFTGVADPGATVTLLVDGVEVATDTASSNGIYIVSIPASFNLADGPRAFRARATDDGGNVGPLSAALTVTIDTAAPVPPGPVNLLTASDSGISGTDDITNDNTPTITGPSEVTSIIKVFASGVDVTTTSFSRVNADWFMTIAQLGEGLRNMTFTEEDLAGNVSAPSPALAVTIDTNPPANPTVAPDLANSSDTGDDGFDNLTNLDTPTFVGAVSNNTFARLFKGATDLGVDTSTPGGVYGVAPTAPFADGPHTLAVRFEDRAGNRSAASPTVTIVIDTIAPAAPTEAPDLDSASDKGTSATDNITNDATPSFDGLVPGGNFVRLFAGAQDVGFTTNTASGKYALTAAALPAGVVQIATRFEDAAGNLSPASPALAVTIDTTAPAVTSREFEFLNGHALRFTFTENVGPSLTVADLDLDNLTSRESIPTASIARTFSANTARFTFPGFANSVLPDGNYLATILTAGVTDIAGNPLAAANSTLEFYARGGDAVRDRTVDFNDLVRLAQNYNTAGGMTAETGDFNNDDTVDFNDLVTLAQRYNTTLPPHPAMSPPVTAAAATETLAASKQRAKPTVFNTTTPIRRPAPPPRPGRTRG